MLQLLRRVTDLQKSVWKNNYGHSRMKNGARGNRRTVEQERNKGQRLLKNNPNYTATQQKRVCPDLAHINQMIGWQPRHHAQWVVLFWQRAATKNVAGMANCDKSLSVYPVFGTLRGTNPALRWSWIPVLTHTRLSGRSEKTMGAFWAR